MCSNCAVIVFYNSSPSILCSIIQKLITFKNTDTNLNAWLIQFQYEPDLLKMCIRQAYQSLEMKITADSWYAFMWPVNFGDQRSCFDIECRFLDGNNWVLSVCDVSGQWQPECLSFCQILAS